MVQPNQEHLKTDEITINRTKKKEIDQLLDITARRFRSLSLHVMCCVWLMLMFNNCKTKNKNRCTEIEGAYIRFVFIINHKNNFILTLLG